MVRRVTGPLGPAAEATRAELRPADGVLVRFVLTDPGTDGHRLLLVVVHHLAVDAVSWQILLPDLRDAWEAVRDGRPPVLAPVGTSVREWSRRLHELAHDPARVAELPLWTSVLDGAGTGPALDPARDVVATLRELTVTLPPEVTAPLLGEVPAAFHATVDDVLLTGLAQAVQHVRGAGAPVVVDVEGHGRHELLDDLDTSRTVGWFTSLTPVRLDPGPDPAQALKRVKEQRRALPDGGIGFGLLRHLNAATAPVLAALPTPRIGFNYLGRSPAAAARGDWTEADERGPAGRDPDMAAPHVVSVNAATTDHPDGPRLSATWQWPAALLTEDRVAALAEAWVEALRGLAGRTDGGHTPSDLLLELDQDEIDELEQELRYAR